ncbi:unnamed protein product [Moneuplotes crassus]|uniref:DNA topoisomerase 2 n=2 Tax=Euplotes crassus TaxID=5936 RepID=A0AAD1UF41_EUPCR|nr:unnamed protein product [Moneuplotes crassus]
MPKKDLAKLYQKKTPIEHILDRPDTYIGSTEFSDEKPLWVWDEDSQGIVKKPTKYVPGLYKIFDEILVNAVDNFHKSKEEGINMTSIKVTIDKELNKISVCNNGETIPVEIHPEYKIYCAEMIFGQLLTSSNYDDEKEKVTGGRNGYGAKLTNIYSTKFVVETGDIKNSLSFKQTFSKNMSNKGDPIIKEYKGKDNYTKITFIPDLRRFGMDGFDDDIMAIFTKRVYDIAGITPASVRVYLNDKRVEVKNFKSYVDLYFKNKEIVEEELNVFYEKDKKGRWEFSACLSEGDFQQVSFVNSICTTLGGTHVDYLADQITSHVQTILKKKHKKDIKPNQIKANLWLFVNSQIVNPAFDSQTKDTLTTKPSKFGSTFILPPKFLQQMAETGLTELVLKVAGAKEEAKLKRLGGKRKKRVTGIDKLDDANMAGRKDADKCTLIITEGDSAKTFADAGIAEIGRDYFGTFPLRGKFLNVRDAPIKKITSNKEIQHLLEILGLKIGTKYTDKKNLRYGNLMVMADQDHDGSHIKGLVINFIHKFWPSLIKMNTYLKEFATPIIKARKGDRQVETFFTQQEYDQWKRGQGRNLKKWTIKYYKGLGTSDNEEAKEYFSRLEDHTLNFRYTGPDDDKQIELAFSDKLADARKEWLNTYDENEFVDHSNTHVTYRDFVNKELIGFSRYNCTRAIPSVCDGYKPGQRKIMFSCFKRNLVQEMKVAQLIGYVGEKSAYHHGEQSLATTIVGLAQNFVGSNNISVLEPRGQFGSRAMGGKDAASARYIHTKLAPITDKIFHPHDKFLLKYLTEDGHSIEPQYYVPVIPMVLVNGSEGIGTGWSTNIPCYNPFEIIQALKDRMDGKEFHRMDPWYKHYKGDIYYDNNTFKCDGKFAHNPAEGILKITELPIKKWTRDYKKFLEEMLDNNKISDLREYHGTNQVEFEIYYDEGSNGFDSKLFKDTESIMKYFKLTTTISDKNFVLFNSENKLKLYADETEILDEFYDVRLKLYETRKDYMIRKLECDLEILENKERFIGEVVDETIIVNKKKKKELLSILSERGYSRHSHIIAKIPEDNAMKGDVDLSESDNDEDRNLEDEEEKLLATDYNYLLNQSIWSLTEERIEALRQERLKKEEEIEKLKELEIKDIWRSDLDEILKELRKIDSKEIKDMEKANNKMEKLKKKGKPKKKGKKRKISTDSNISSFIEKPKVEKKPPPKKDRIGGKIKDAKALKAKKDLNKHLSGAKSKKTSEKSVTDQDSNQLSAQDIEELPLIERMKLKMKMKDIEEREEKKDIKESESESVSKVHEKMAEERKEFKKRRMKRKR